MIQTFPSSDPLHLFDLGVMRRCLTRWVFSEKGYERKWNNDKIATASQLLLNCQTYMPNDIHRAIRNLNCLRKWKGLEYRTVLLYVGIVVFQEVLNADEYNHFLMLCCAVRICSSRVFKDYLSVAERMFKLYVQKYIPLYGRHTIGSNVHLLTHVVEDMEANNVENIMDISTYKYENCLRLLGLNLRHGNLPLEQVSRRIIEISQVRSKSECHSLFNPEKFSPQVFGSSQPLMTTYQKVQITPEVMLNSKKLADSWILTKTDEIVKMEYVKMENNEYKIVGTAIKEKSALFTCPMNSIKLKIFSSDGKMHDESRTYDLSTLAAKMMCLPTKDKFAFIPILHTML